jgi:hypothetical protein
MPQNNNWFFPLKRSPHRQKIAALDCEGNGSRAGFVCAAVVSDRGKFTFTDRQAAIDYIFSRDLRDYWIFAHNLEYDLSTLMSGDLRPYRVLFAGDRILWCELVSEDRHKWRLVDSTNIFTATSIEDLGLDIGHAKIELHPTLMEHLRQGLPLHLLDGLDQRRVLDYCLRDAEILYLALEAVQEEILSVGGQLKPTVAGISMDIFRRKFMEKPWPVIDPVFNRLARTAYFGARTEPYILGRCEHVNGYDISSLYPSVMREIDFPYPGYLVLDDQPSGIEKILSKEGITQCTIDIPDDDPPILPGRLKSHLFFPTGELTQAWPHTELRYALDHGAKVKKVDWSLWSNYVFSPFQDFIDRLYERRCLCASSSKVKERLFKLLLNSAYGRFGISEDGGLKELIAITDDNQWNDLRGATLYYLNNWPYALRDIVDTEPLPYANNFISAYVTAAGRIKMHGLIKQSIGKLIYTDTDSLWTFGEIPTNEGIGQLRQVESDRDFWVVAPKEYAVFSGEYMLEAHAKGIPEAHRLMYLKRGTASFDAPVGLREGLRGGLTPATWINRIRTKRYSLPKRPPVAVTTEEQTAYPTRPWSWPELQLAFDLAEAERPYFQDGQSPKVAHLLARAEAAQPELK